MQTIFMGFLGSQDAVPEQAMARPGTEPEESLRVNYSDIK
jgi:hypothetical protein